MAKGSSRISGRENDCVNLTQSTVFYKSCKIKINKALRRFGGEQRRSIMNVVIYARFSSHSQTEQSIEGQLKVCYEYAEQNHYTVVGEYIDRAMSGKYDNRAEFQRMISDSDKHTFEGVLVYQLDRFARNRYDSAIYKAKLKKEWC